MDFETVFGIDFGTTCSAVVGCASAGDTHRITHYGDNEGRPVLSAISIDRATGNPIVGRDAWKQAVENSTAYEYIPSIKRLLGTDWNARLENKRINVIDVSAHLFSHLRKITEQRTGLAMHDAVVAVPVGFSGSSRRQLRRAAAEAGLNITTFVNEPTAAFFANLEGLKGAEYVAVFDWGGGTLDVTVLRHADGCVYELASAGIPKAGNDIDELLARRIHARLAAKSGVHISFDEMDAKARGMMMNRCEIAKRSMSSAESANVTVNRYGALGTVRETIYYDWFRELLSPLVDEAYGCFLVAVQQAGLSQQHIDRILMTGGSSNLRPLQERFEQTCPDKLEMPEETTWNVAEGAARIATSPGNHSTNQQISLILSDGSEFVLLEKDTVLSGWNRTNTFGIVDTTGEARLIFGGSEDICQDAERYRSLCVPHYGFLSENLILDSTVDEDLIFRVTARSDRRSDYAARVWEYARLKTYYRLSEEPQE